MAIIEKPINVFTVANQLGYYEYAPHPVTGQTVRKVDVGRLCTHANINKWSKKKPVRQPHISTDGLEDWWKAFDGKCGLNVPVYTSAGSITTVGGFLYDLKENLVDWSYLKPLGSSGSPYRAGDFIGYEKDAIYPIGSMDTYNTFIDLNDTIQIDLEEVVQYPNDYNLTLQDLTHNGVSMSNYYIGVMLYQSNNQFIIATSQTPISTGNLSIVLNNMNSRLGTWKGAFFMCSEPITQGGTLPLAIYIPIDIKQSNVIINAQGSLYSIVPEGVWNINNTRVNYDLVVTNGSPSPKLIEGITSVLIETNVGESPSEGVAVRTNNHSDITVAGNGTDVIVGNTFIYTRNQSKDYWIGSHSDIIPIIYNQIEDYSDM